MYATALCASVSLDAIKGVPGSRESIWYRGKILGLVSQRLNHFVMLRKVDDDLVGAVLLLAQIEVSNIQADGSSDYNC